MESSTIFYSFTNIKAKYNSYWNDLPEHTAITKRTDGKIKITLSKYHSFLALTIYHKSVFKGRNLFFEEFEQAGKDKNQVEKLSFGYEAIYLT